MDVFQQAIEESRRKFEAQQARRRRLEEKRLAELKKKKEEEAARKKEEKRQKVLEEQAKAQKEKEEQEQRKKDEEEELWQMRHEFFEKQDAAGKGIANEEFTETLQSVFTKFEETDNEETLNRGNLGSANRGSRQCEVSEPSEPTMGPLSKSRNDADTAHPSSQIATPSLLDEKEGTAEFNQQLDRDKEADQMTTLERNSDLNYKNINKLIYQAQTDRSSLLSNSKIDEQEPIQLTSNLKGRADGLAVDSAAHEKQRIQQDFYQTERVNDTSPDKIGDSYFPSKRDSDALLAVGKRTVPDGLSKHNQVMAQEGFNQLNDPQKNNFMQSQSQFQPAESNNYSASNHKNMETSSPDRSAASAKQSTLTWEQKQLLLLEQQQNELQLKLLKMQEEFQKQALSESASLKSAQDEKARQNIVQPLNETMKETMKLSKQLEALKKDIQGEQEEMIRSIVLKSAVCGQDEREFDPDKTLKDKTGAYKEEFIRSICNKSGVFVKEFREMKEDPYAREEFILSINMKSAKAGRILDEQPKEKELDIYQKTIQKSEKNIENAMKNKKDRQNPAISRKKQLVYELEVKDKMREIQTSKYKQQMQEEKKRLEVGKNLFAQLMSEAPVMNEADSFGQQQLAGAQERQNDTIAEANNEENEVSDQDDEIERAADNSDEAENAQSELFSVSQQNLPEVDASTGTFGEKSGLQDQLQQFQKQREDKPRIRSARPKHPPLPKNQSSSKKDDGQSQAAGAQRNRPFSGLSKSSIPVRSNMDSSETKTMTDGSSLNLRDDDASADFEKDSRIEYAKLQNEREIDKQQILIDIKNAESYKFGSQRSAKSVIKEEDQQRDARGPGGREDDAEQNDDNTDFDDRDEDDDVDLQADERLEVEKSQVSDEELERYRNLIEIAIHEEHLGESQPELLAYVDMNDPMLASNPDGHLRIEDSAGRSISKKGDSTFRRDDDSQFNALGDSYNANLMNERRTAKVADSFENRTFDRGSTIKDRSIISTGPGGYPTRSDIQGLSLQSRDLHQQQFSDPAPKKSTFKGDSDRALESELADEVPSMHATVRNDASKYEDEEEQLDPAPKTSAGQARHFYYETDGADVTVKSKDYDDLYEHGHTYDLADMAKSAVRRSNGELVDKDELTFGSRPPTAPEKKQKGDDQPNMHTPSVRTHDNSMVLMGQITIDRKNELLGNRFQDPGKNQHEPESAGGTAPGTLRRLDFDAHQLEKEKHEQHLKQEFLALQQQNEDILAQIAQQKKQNEANFANIMNGLEYQLEDTKKEEAARRGGEDHEEDEDYEEDFEHFQEKSDDEGPETPAEQQKRRITNAEASMGQASASLMDSKYQLKVREEGNSPKQLAKDKSQSKYYEDLEESHQLKLKQDENDPLKEFYQMKEARRQRDDSEDFNAGFPRGQRKNDHSDYSEEPEDRKIEFPLGESAIDDAFAHFGQGSGESAEQQAPQQSEPRKRKAWAMCYGFSEKGKDADASDNINDHINFQEDEGSEEDGYDSPPKDAQESMQEQQHRIPKEQMVIDFTDEQGETMKERKMKKFQEFKQRREQQDEQRRLKAQQRREDSRKRSNIEDQAPQYQINDDIPQTDKAPRVKKIQDIMSPGNAAAIPPKPKGTNSQMHIANRTPNLGRLSRENTHLHKQMRPNQSNNEVPGIRQGSNARKNSAQRLQTVINSARQKQKAPNNWISADRAPTDFNDQSSRHTIDDEESKYDQEAHQEPTRLPPLIPQTPPLSVKSTNAPQIMPRKALVKNSNKKLIRNSIQFVVLSGQSEQSIKERQELLEVIDSTNFAQYVILFKGQSGRFDLRGLYAVTGTEQFDNQLTRIHGQASSLCPPIIDDVQIEKFFKYSSGQRNFNEIGGQKSLTPTTDAIVLRKIKKGY